MNFSQLQFPDNLDSATFLRDYWQQRPLLLRQGLPGYICPLSPDELAGLACEAEVEARLVLEKDGIRPWEARHGPFDEQTFANLPETHWTLLVQDVDKHVPEVAQLLQAFRFLPDWRVDDIMISYAPAHGSVGPHVDDYDVFLVQGWGKRRWRINTRPVAEEDYIDGLDLRILPHFEAEQEWSLAPGDVLYLPPNVAHWGIAEDACLTCSVGFRAPLLRDLARSWAEHLIERQLPAGRYRDHAITPQAHGGEILASVFQQLQDLLSPLSRMPTQDFQRWLGCHLSETKDNLQPIAPSSALTPDDFHARFRRHGAIERSGYARLAFCLDDNARLFANGHDFALSSEKADFLRQLTDRQRLGFDSLAPWMEDAQCRQLLCTLHNQGLFEFSDE
jgi:50S ribosomal protein L16 3-hydroxylase